MAKWIKTGKQFVSNGLYSNDIFRDVKLETGDFLELLIGEMEWETVDGFMYVNHVIYGITKFLVLNGEGRRNKRTFPRVFISSVECPADREPIIGTLILNPNRPATWRIKPLDRKTVE